MITGSGPTEQIPATADVPLHRERNFATLGFRCGVVGALTWFAMGVESVLRPFQDNRRETFWLLPFVLTMITFVCVHLIQRRRSRIAGLGFAAIAAASGLILIGNLGLQLNVTWLQVLVLLR